MTDMVNNAGGTGGNSAAAQAVAGTAKDKAGQVSSTAADQAGQVASSAADQARRVTGEAADQARNLLGEARDNARRQGEAQTEQVASALGRLRDEAAALIDGRPEDAPALTGHGRTVVDRLDEVVRRLESGGLQGAAQDVQGFARRRPVAFLVGAGLLGFAAGRAVRAGREVHRDDSSPALGGSPQAAYPPVPSVPPVPPIPPVPSGLGEPTIPIPNGGYAGSIPPPPPAPPRPSEYLDR